jgi:hypothetical protein
MRPPPSAGARIIVGPFAAAALYLGGLRPNLFGLAVTSTEAIGAGAGMYLALVFSPDSNLMWFTPDGIALHRPNGKTFTPDLAKGRMVQLLDQSV